MPNTDLICENLTINEKDHLCFAGIDTSELAGKYSTPLYLMDEDRIRKNCRTYLDGAKKAFGEGRCEILYASKAASFLQMYRIMKDENMGIDVVSAGEIYTAAKAGFPMKRAFFHSNNKTDADIRFAMDHQVGHFVVDSEEELRAIDAIAKERNIKQKIVLRLTPGIDPHTFEEVATGKIDSKFGFGIETGIARDITLKALQCENVQLDGFHCHVGSQVFDSDVFFKSAEIMLDFMNEIKKETGYEAGILNLGGGYGVRYMPSDPALDIGANLAQVAECVRKKCEKLGYTQPMIALEPGRSIVADAGLTLYTVGSVKKIPGFSNYVSVDGGMTDNPRFALYEAKHYCLPAGRMDAERDMTCFVVGRCCESGDIIQPDVAMPSDIKRGDLVAVLTTGAYNFSMASNYNRIERPAVVMIKEGQTYVAVRRQTMEDLVQQDL